MKITNYALLERYYEIGMILAVGVASCVLGFGHDRFVTYLLTGTLEANLGLSVLAASAFWLLRFSSATRRELDLFEEYHILERINPIEWQEEVAAVVVSLAFGGLIGAVIYPIIFCVIAVAIQVGDCVGIWMIQRAFFEVAQEPDGLDRVISEYYFYKPHFLHRVAKLVGFMTALVFSALAQSSQRSNFGVLSWIVVLTTIVGGEGVLLCWRHWLKVGLSEQRGTNDRVRVRLTGAGKSRRR